MTQDITSLLVNETESRVENIEPEKENDFLAQIPKSNISTTLPPAVIQALSEQQAKEKEINTRELGRVDKTISNLKNANKEIQDASSKINETQGSMGLSFLGIFDSDYNLSHQRGRITKAKEKLSFDNAIMEQERLKDTLELRESGMPIEAFTSLTKLQGAKATMQAQILNSVVQSNTAKKLLREQYQNLYTPDQLDKMLKNKQGDEIWSLQELQARSDELRDAELDYESKLLSTKEKRFDLNEKYENRILNKIPLSTAQYALDVALKEGSGTTTIPGTKIQIPTDRLKTVMSQRLVAKQEADMKMAKIMYDTVSTNGEFSTAMSGIQSVSAVFGNAGNVFDNFSSINMLNITPEVYSKIPFDSMHPKIRTEAEKLFGVLADFNEKSKPKFDSTGNRLPPEPVKTEELQLIKESTSKLNANIKELQTNMLNTTADKNMKAGLNEFFTNGKMTDDTNSANVMISNSVSMNEYGGDHALQASHSVLLENIHKQLNGDSLSGLEGEELSQAVLLSITNSGFKGKPDAKNIIRKAYLTKNKNGLTPFGAYIGNKSQEIVAVTMDKMIDEYPEFAGYFQRLGKEIGYTNQKDFAGALAELSFRMQEKNPELPDLVLNHKFIELATQYIESNSSIWNSQQDVIRGSHMNLMFTNQPSVMINQAISDNFGTSSRSGWDILKSEQKQRDIMLERTPAGASRERIREASSFSPIALPSY